MKSVPPSAEVDDLSRLRRGLPEVTGHEPATVGLDQVPLGEHAERAVDARQDARHGRLAGAGVADEDQVPAAIGDGQPVLAAQRLDAREADELVHLVA